MRFYTATAEIRPSGSRRSWSSLAGLVLMGLIGGVSLTAQAEQLTFYELSPETAEVAPYAPEYVETWPDGTPVAPEPVYTLDGYPRDPMAPPSPRQQQLGPSRYFTPVMSWFGLRHSSTNGRYVGLGRPLIGASWLNRPYYFGAELGTLWLTRGMDEGVSRDTDTVGGFFLGWDWDHYWGSEFRFDWATPELENRLAPEAPRTDSLFVWNYSFMYYPWGDSQIRPYWRWGIGNTHVDFPTAAGTRHDEWLLTFPIGLGVKYPLRRWLAVRAEFTDLLAIGQHGIPTQHNLALTFGFEWHFGVQPKSYWPWYPSRHVR